MTEGPDGVEVVVATVYCPRCDRPYSAKTRPEAMKIMEAHLLKHNEDMPSAETEG